MKILNEIFRFWIDASNLYDRLKNSDKRERSVALGVHSIICLLCGAVFGVLSALGLVASIAALHSDSLIAILAILGVIVCLGGAVASLFNGFLKSLLYWIYQLKLNKRAVGKVAMAIWIICVIGVVIGCVFIVTKL